MGRLGRGRDEGDKGVKGRGEVCHIGCDWGNDVGLWELMEEEYKAVLLVGKTRIFRLSWTS